jgi:hypothetical protein
MTATLIRNHDHLKQPVDFSGIPFFCQDIDFCQDFGGKAYVFADFKYGDATFTPGELIHVRQLVQKLGKSAPVFYVCANHNHPSSSDGPIWAGATLVTDVYYSRPDMEGLVGYHRYSKEDDYIRLSEFTATVALCIYQHERLSEPLGYPYFCFDAVLSAFWDSKTAVRLRQEEVSRLKRKGLDARYSPIMLFRHDVTTAELRDSYKRDSHPIHWTWNLPKFKNVPREELATAPRWGFIYLTTNIECLKDSYEYQPDPDYGCMA